MLHRPSSSGPLTLIAVMFGFTVVLLLLVLAGPAARGAGTETLTPMSSTLTAQIACDAPARRALANRGASPSEWRAFAACLVDRIRKRRTILFLHVSKAGGTSLCRAAEWQGCVSASFGSAMGGCWAGRFDDGPRWIEQGRLDPLPPSYLDD
eukprot:298027-Prymnesium_polylepis.1